TARGWAWRCCRTPAAPPSAPSPAGCAPAAWSASSPTATCPPPWRRAGHASAAGTALVTDIGVRLPAHLTASGRAILAHLPEAQVRALYPRPGDLITRTGRGPRSLAELLDLLAADRARGWSEESELVSEGLRSLGTAVFDHHGHPVAALSTTWRRHYTPHDPERVREELGRAAARLTSAVSGRAPGAG
ncbi:IclR family transcriptional regulator domain-containing protein, partial [Streptomyces albidoflavus]|uniref:IclR family transcriptional regulator domain-containing protein n=1 Tax=Streptomyces albidoflavus TaxID=1886 RepID=UPI0027B9F43C